MARAAVENGKLRGCPTCGTKVAEADLKLRDFSWVNEALPGKVGGMDVDFVLSSVRSGRTLAIEMKPPGAYISVGAKLTFKTLIETGRVDVWVVWGPDSDGQVEVAHVTKSGNLTSRYRLPTEVLAGNVALWWEEQQAGEE